FEPCSPRCANWLRYGVQPDGAKAGMVPGFCRSKAHRREHLGYAGRRVLVSRKWSGKTVADHKADRLRWVLDALGVDPDADPDEGQDDGAAPALSSVSSGDHAWELARPTDPDVPPREHRLLRAVGEALKRRAQLDAVRQHQLNDDLSATPERAA
ncbi:replication initiator, partial [Streptomonospora salina]